MAVILSNISTELHSRNIYRFTVSVIARPDDSEDPEDERCIGYVSGHLFDHNGDVSELLLRADETEDLDLMMSIVAHFCERNGEDWLESRSDLRFAVVDMISVNPQFDGNGVVEFLLQHAMQKVGWLKSDYICTMGRYFPSEFTRALDVHETTNEDRFESVGFTKHKDRVDDGWWYIEDTKHVQATMINFAQFVSEQSWDDKLDTSGEGHKWTLEDETGVYLSACIRDGMLHVEKESDDFTIILSHEDVRAQIFALFKNKFENELKPFDHVDEQFPGELIELPSEIFGENEMDWFRYVLHEAMELDW